MFKLNQCFRQTTPSQSKARPALLGAMVFLAALAVSGAAPVTAGPMVFQDEASFNAAINGGTLTTEGFESLRDGQGGPVTLGNVTIDESPSLNIVTSTDSRFVTEGRRAVEWDAQGFNSITFTFGTAINAFAIDITDFGTFSVNTLRVSIDGGDFFDVFENFEGDIGNELFLGLFDGDASFNSVTFISTTRTNNDVVGFDRLQYGLIEATPVSEPATLALFGLGLAGLGVLRRRKSRATA